MIVRQMEEEEAGGFPAGRNSYYHEYGYEKSGTQSVFESNYNKYVTAYGYNIKVSRSEFGLTPDTIEMQPSNYNHYLNEYDQWEAAIGDYGGTGGQGYFIGYPSKSYSNSLYTIEQLNHQTGSIGYVPGQSISSNYNPLHNGNYDEGYIKVYGAIKRNYRIEYYYNGAIDSSKTITRTANVGTVVTQANVPLYPRENYGLQSIQPTSLTVSTNESSNVIRVYYVSYKLTVDPAGGTYNGSTGLTTTNGAPGSKITINDPVRQDYIFTGWTLTGGGSLSGKTYTYGNSDGRLTANWKPVPVLRIDPRGGTYEGNSGITEIKGLPGTTIEIADPVRENFMFTGWTLEGAGTLNGKNYTYGETDGKLTANWIAKLTVNNKQKYIDVEGIVWNDITRNDLYKEITSEEDIGIEGIEVRLKYIDDNGTEVLEKTTKTDANGNYIFEYIEIAKLEKNAFIEFEYKGVIYTNVAMNLDKTNGSKAIENAQDREEFDSEFINITEDKADRLREKTIIASTREAGYNIVSTRKPHTRAISNINLGLYEREQPDLALLKDLESVLVSINNREQKYSYGLKNMDEKFGANRYIESTNYSQPIYNSDIEYTGDNDLAYLTYKIVVKNQASTIKGQVNQIIDYFDNRFTIRGIGTQIDSQGNTNNNLDWSNNVSQYNNEYNSVIINLGDNADKIDPNNIQVIYVQFAVTGNTLQSVINENDTLKNVAEIYSYTSYNQNDGIYAGIDIDSTPGNCTPGDTSTYEDDADQAPYLSITEATRYIKGNVFEDDTGKDDSVHTGETRLGNGIFDEGEKGIGEITVQLKEKNLGLEYNYTTNENGEYIIEGFIPGEYEIRYIWGNETYRIEDYKSTIIDETRANNNASNPYWYKDYETRYSDAIDDWNTRENIDNNIKNISYGKIEEINNNEPSKMQSVTAEFIIEVEYDNIQDNKDAQKRFEHNIQNIDFGIVERAKQQLELEKTVSKVQIVLANGQVLFSGDPKVDSMKNVKYIEPSAANHGVIDIEMDKELMHGAKLEIEYTFNINNTSELDYINREYYYFGIEGTEDEKVQLAPAMIIDYLDNSIASSEEANTDLGWQRLTEEMPNTGEIIVDGIKLTSELKDTFDKTNTILYNEILNSTYLAPEENTNLKCVVGRLITNQNSEMIYENNAEITYVTKNGGGLLETTPGNYIPDKEDDTGNNPTHEVDDDLAETVTITAPTGENRNYVPFIILGITSLTMISVGIIMIKRKVI